MELHVSDNIAYSSGSNHYFKFESATKTSNTAQATSPQEIATSRSFGDMAPWGDANTYPQDIIEIIRKNGTLSWTTRQLVASIYASGPRVKKRVKDPVTNKVTVVDTIDGDFPQWDAFRLRNPKFYLHQYQKIRDLKRFWLSPVEFIFEGDEIVGLKAHKASHFRRSLQDDNGLSEFGYLNAQWDKGKKVDDPTTSILTIVQNDFDAVDTFRLIHTPDENAMFVITGPCDEELYPIPEWTSILESGWLEISNAEPKLVMALIENQAIINYIIKIKDWYWGAKYTQKAWNKFTAEEKRSKKTETVNSFNEMVGSMKNAGKMVLQDVITQLNLDLESNIQGKPANFKDFQDAWELIVVPQNTFSGSLKEPADTARKEIMMAQGLDVSSFGSVPEQNTQGGSGKSQSMNILQIVTEFIRQLSVLDLEFIKQYNNWDPSMVFTYELPVMQTTANIPVNQRDLKAKQ